MAKLTCVYRQEDISGIKFGKRQLPLVAGDNNLMVNIILYIFNYITCFSRKYCRKQIVNLII